MADASVLPQLLPATRHSPQRVCFASRAPRVSRHQDRSLNERGGDMVSPRNMRFITPGDAHRLKIGCQGRDDRVSLTWEQAQSTVGMQTLGY